MAGTGKGLERQGKAGGVRLGVQGNGGARAGKVWRGRRGWERLGAARIGEARQDGKREETRGLVRRLWSGSAGKARRAIEALGKAR